MKSFFTSIPHDLALNCIKDFLNFNVDKYERTKLNCTQILDLIKLCFEASFFSYRDNIYKQVTGTPMGSPVSVVIAEIVVQEIEKQILQSAEYFGFTMLMILFHAYPLIKKMKY